MSGDTGGQRLFVAVDPPEPALDHLAEFTSGLHVARARARLTRRHTWHITVAFLGAVADARVAAVQDALTTATEGPSARQCQLRIAGGGTFSGRGGAVLWAGVTGELERLRQVARAVGRELRAARFEPDRRRYQPHLTIARPGDRLARDLLAEDVAALRGYQGPAWQAAEIHLVRSFLGADPRYVRLASFPLPPR